MGMRMDQLVGLNEWAQAFVKGCGRPHFTGRYEQAELVISDLHETGVVERPVVEQCIRREPSGEHYYGMFDDRYDLFRYTLRDGRVFYEKVQADPWSSGPVFFLALVDEEGNWVHESLWSKEAIEAA